MTDLFFLRGAGLFFERLEVGFDAGEGVLVHAVDEEDAVEVVGFVLNAAGEEAVATEGVGDAVFVVVTDADFGGAHDIAANVGKGEAAFFVGVGFVGLGGELGVDERHRHEEVERRDGAVEFPGEIAFGVAEVHDAELESAPDLLGGEADAVGIVHRVHHIRREFAEGGVKDGDAFSFLAENGGIKMDDRQDHGRVRLWGQSLGSESGGK